jgi:hypothetical protein
LADARRLAALADPRAVRRFLAPDFAALTALRFPAAALAERPFELRIFDDDLRAFDAVAFRLAISVSFHPFVEP